MTDASRISDRLRTWGLAGIVTVSLVSSYIVYGLHTKTTHAVEALEKIMSTTASKLEARWKSGGIDIVFVATKEPGETPTQFAARARVEFDSMLTQFPKDIE